MYAIIFFVAGSVNIRNKIRGIQIAKIIHSPLSLKVKKCKLDPSAVDTQR